jgi:general secretion pathway protein D
MGLIQTLDRPRDQVLLEVTLVTVTSTNGFNLGVELSGASINGEDTEMVGFSVFGIGRANASTGALRIAQPPPLGLNYAVFNTGDFSVVLNALETIGDTRIKSSPTILIQDNAEATISQLDEEPFEVTSQGDATTITSFGGFVEAGTTLTVLPHVSSFDWLRLDYAITFSSFGSRTAEQTAANLPPPRRQNVLQGTVRVPSDYTVVIGGLANGREDRNIDQIPFLGNIPLLGELLKNRSENNQQATLFVFIRPVILRDAGFEDLLHLSEHEIRRAELERGQDLSNPLKMMVPLDTVLPKTEVQP